jgi:Na+/H+-dicarboxylate symporter/ABC-type amino acid transport substrate-binding protein
VQVLVGLTLGVAVGLFFGESAAGLKVVADGYVQLLRMTVLPFVTVSLLAGVGSLSAAQARLLATHVGLLLLALWSVTLVLVFLMPLTFPNWESASFFSTAMLATPEDFDFLDLFIPANPFNSLANAVVPAVVFFSVVVGVALITVENKESFLDWLRVVRAALGRVATFIVKLAPIGLFAIAATLAGTLRPEELERVQVYLITYGAFAALLVLWIIPGLLCALTPVKYREVFGLTRDALVTSVLIGELLIVLPALTEASRELVRRHLASEKRPEALTDVIVPASFNFPHAGKILTLSFVLFAAWFSETNIPWTEAPRLAFTGVLTSFASLNAAIPYLLDAVRVPADTFQLFLATGLVNSRVGTAVAAVHTVALATLGAFATAGGLTITTRRLVRYGLISAMLAAGLTIGLRVFFESAFDHAYTKDRVLMGMHLIRSDANTRTAGTAQDETPDAPGTPLLTRIRTRGHLRVGYVPDSLPFAFVNERGDTVGFDVEMGHRLAQDLGVGLTLVPADDRPIPEQLAAGAFDILMSGMPLTSQGAEQLAFSRPYFEEHLAFVVEDHRRGEFSSLESIRQLPRVRLAMPNVPYYASKIRELLPKADVVPFATRGGVAQFFAQGTGGSDALVLTAERGSAWSLLYPRYSVAIPQPQMLTVPLAYPAHKDNRDFIGFLDQWLELKRRDGTIEELNGYWVLGRNARPVEPRWSVIRNVLHWVD